MVGGMLISILPEWLRPAGFARVLARVIVNYNVNVWLGLFALVYSVVVAAWLPACWSRLVPVAGFSETGPLWRSTFSMELTPRRSGARAVLRATLREDQLKRRETRLLERDSLCCPFGAVAFA